MNEAVDGDIEDALTDELALHGISTRQARILFFVAANSFSRGREELGFALKRYPGLEDVSRTTSEIEVLLEKGLLKEVATRVGSLVSIAMEKLPSTKSHELLARARQSFDQTAQLLTVVGRPGEHHSYTSLLGLLGRAERTIDLWIASASSYTEALGIIAERATAGVKVRILLASAKAVVSVRGPVAGRGAIDVIARVKRTLRGNRNVEIRLFQRNDDFVFSGSVQVDGNLVRFVIFDHLSQRGMEGVLIECRSQRGRKTNLIHEIEARFDTAWNEAVPVNLLGRVGALGRRLDADGVLAVVSIVVLLVLHFNKIDKPYIDLALGAAGTGLLLLSVRLLRLLGRAMKNAARRLIHD